jgi:hypothetical protein
MRHYILLVLAKHCLFEVNFSYCYKQDAADALMELSVLEEADSDNDSSNPEETTILIGPSDPADNEENPKDDSTPAPEPDFFFSLQTKSPRDGRTMVLLYRPGSRKESLLLEQWTT